MKDQLGLATGKYFQWQNRQWNVFAPLEAHFLEHRVGIAERVLHLRLRKENATGGQTWSPYLAAWNHCQAPHPKK